MKRVAGKFEIIYTYQSYTYQILREDCHGTLGTRLNAYIIDPWARHNDITVVCPERPGYGLSIPMKNYTLLSHAEDVRFLMQTLGCLPYRSVSVPVVEVWTNTMERGLD
jgi:hypothetical protein